MSRREQGLAEITVERRLLQEVCDLVRRCEGRLSLAALDVVLSGVRRPVASCFPGSRRPLHSPGRRRPGSGRGLPSAPR